MVSRSSPPSQGLFTRMGDRWRARRVRIEGERIAQERHDHWGITRFHEAFATPQQIPLERFGVTARLGVARPAKGRPFSQDHGLHLFATTAFTPPPGVFLAYFTQPLVAYADVDLAGAALFLGVSRAVDGCLTVALHDHAGKRIAASNISQGHSGAFHIYNSVTGPRHVGRGYGLLLRRAIDRLIGYPDQITLHQILATNPIHAALVEGISRLSSSPQANFLSSPQALGGDLPSALVRFPPTPCGNDMGASQKSSPRVHMDVSGIVPRGSLYQRTEAFYGRPVRAIEILRATEVQQSHLSGHLIEPDIVIHFAPRTPDS